MHELERSDPIRPDLVRPERVRFGLIRPVTLLACLALLYMSIIVCNKKTGFGLAKKEAV